MDRFRRAWIATAALVLFVICPTGRNAPGGDAEEQAESPPVFTATKKWTVLHRMPPRVADFEPLPESSPIHIEDGLKVTGVRPNHPLWFATFESDSDWAIGRYGLQTTRGKDAALRVARAGDFDLEGSATAEGLGGWFFLVGWNAGHGYLLYQVTTKESGSPWNMAEVRGGKAIEETHRELARHVWKGPQPFRLAVAEGKIGLLVGRDEVFKNVAVPNYAEGNILMGTYDTKYGPKKLRIQNLRVRAR